MYKFGEKVRLPDGRVGTFICQGSYGYLCIHMWPPGDLKRDTALWEDVIEIESCKVNKVKQLMFNFMY